MRTLTPETAPTPSGVPAPTGGWKTLHHFGRTPTKEETRRERERLGIVPKQAKKIEKLAEKLADRIEAEQPNEILIQIKADREFQILLATFAKRDAERRAMIAEFAAKLILAEIISARDEEEAAIITLLMEM